MKPRDPILMDVFKAFGGQSKLAQYLSLTRQSVTQWEKVPLKHVRAIARYTGMSPAVLRPDIYADI
jgi:DNA-binding transcriptional regulator YdaS (Cro superfamily)